MNTVIALNQTTLIIGIAITILINVIDRYVNAGNVPMWFKTPITLTWLGCIIVFITTLIIIIIFPHE